MQTGEQTVIQRHILLDFNEENQKNPHINFQESSINLNCYLKSENYSSKFPCEIVTHVNSKKWVILHFATESAMLHLTWQNQWHDKLQHFRTQKGNFLSCPTKKIVTLDRKLLTWILKYKWLESASRVFCVMLSMNCQSNLCSLFQLQSVSSKVNSVDWGFNPKHTYLKLTFE